jgi:hypothetical protein
MVRANGDGVFLPVLHLVETRALVRPSRLVGHFDAKPAEICRLRRGNLDPAQTRKLIDECAPPLPVCVANPLRIPMIKVPIGVETPRLYSPYWAPNTAVK